eukprot:scaffold245333_cov29-Prasinocladus_malaysianus.AAC.1
MDISGGSTHGSRCSPERLARVGREVGRQPGHGPRRAPVEDLNHHVDASEGAQCRLLGAHCLAPETSSQHNKVSQRQAQVICKAPYQSNIPHKKTNQLI